MKRERHGRVRCSAWLGRICNDLRRLKNKCRNLHFAVDTTAYVMQSLRMTTNTTATIKAGQTLTARSVCDYECVFTAEVLERKGAFVTVKAQGNTRRVKVMNLGDGEFIYAMGKYSMCPIFRAV